MAARYFKGVHLSCLEIECLLGLADARCRLERHTETDRSAVGNASVCSAGSVLQRSSVLSDRVIMLGTFHAGRFKSVTEFQSAHSWYREYRMSQHCLKSVPERFTISGINVWDDAFNHGTEAVTFLYGLVNRRLPLLRHLSVVILNEVKNLPSQFHNPGTHSCKRSLIQNSRIRQDLLRHDSSRNNRQCQSS